MFGIRRAYNYAAEQVQEAEAANRQALEHLAEDAAVGAVAGGLIGRWLHNRRARSHARKSGEGK